MADTVLLADGTVLVVGGGQKADYGEPVFGAEIYHPASGTWTVMAAQRAPQMYRSRGAAAGRPGAIRRGKLRPAAADRRDLLAALLFKGARPVISSAPSAISYGRGFAVSTPNAARIKRVALVKAAAVTHTNNFDQRYVDCTFSASGGRLHATAPPNGNHARPAGTCCSW